MLLKAWLFHCYCREGAPHQSRGCSRLWKKCRKNGSACRKRQSPCMNDPFMASPSHRKGDIQHSLSTELRKLWVINHSNTAKGSRLQVKAQCAQTQQVSRTAPDAFASRPKDWVARERVMVVTDIDQVSSGNVLVTADNNLPPAKPCQGQFGWQHTQTGILLPWPHSPSVRCRG